MYECKLGVGLDVQDNRNLRLVSVNIIEVRGGEDHRVSRSSMLGSEFSRDSILE